MRPRLRDAVRRLRPGGDPDAERWRRYLGGVEPALASAPRVHRFARPPLVGRADTESAPLAIWIEGDDRAACAGTRASLELGSVGPALVLGGKLGDALAATRCEHVALVRAGDVLAPLALERLGQAVALAPDATVITSDDDRLDDDGTRHTPRFRPGPSPDRWLACDDSGPLLVVQRRRAAAAVGGLSGAPGWRHELALELAGPGGGQHAHVPAMLCHRKAAIADPPLLAPDVLDRLLARHDPGAVAELSDGARRIRRAPGREPRVEVIVCLRDRPELLARCAQGVLERTDYERLALALVDNGSREPATLEVLARLERDRRVRVLRDDRPFNFAALNNAAARSSQADVLVFLNNDTEVVEGAWLATLLEEALRPCVGAVSGLLLYPGGAVQHAGAAIGLHGYAGHPFAGLAPSAPTPFGRADGGTRNWMAVTAACLMIERAKFEQVGGFDESFVVAGNDVDLCLRLTEAGYRSLCVPHAVLIHDESVSRGSHIDPGDFVRSQQSYGEFRTVGDPFYNPNLTLSRTDCSVRVPGEAPA